MTIDLNGDRRGAGEFALTGHLKNKEAMNGQIFKLWVQCQSSPAIV